MGSDIEWWKQVIGESRFGSLRQLAPHIKRKDGGVLDGAMLSRLLRGERDVALGEARQLADLLELPMSEVIRKLGVPFGRRDNATDSGSPSPRKKGRT